MRNADLSKSGNVLLCLIAVAKRTSVFDDPTTEIQELTAVIKQDITALNSAVVDLQLHSNARNECGNRDTTSHSTTVVDDLKNRLMTATKEFKEVLTMRTEVRPDAGYIFLVSLHLKRREKSSLFASFLTQIYLL